MSNVNVIAQLKQQIHQLNELARDGVLPQDQVQAAKARLEKQLLDAVMASDLPQEVFVKTQAGQADAASKSSPRIPVRMVTGLTLFVLAVGAAGYAWLGQPEAWRIGPGGTPSASMATDLPQDAGSSPHATDASQITAMTESLAAKLQSDPKNAEGWAMLARSYAVLGRFADATPAYMKAIALRPDDAQLYADYADAIAAGQDHKLEGEPSRLIAKALALDPNNFKALFLSGTIAFDKQDYKAAAGSWEQALKHTPADNPGMTTQLVTALNDARQRLGLPPVDAPPTGNPSTVAPVATGAQVAGQVVLKKDILDQVNPTDTVFIFARAAQGPKMPLAVMRRQVKDLPSAFALTDAMAMSAQLKLSDYPNVVVGARVSRSGQAMPQPGDWQGLSAPVKLGTKDIRIEINEAVK